MGVAGPLTAAGSERHPASARSELHVYNCGEASGALGGRLETKSISQIDLKALELVSHVGSWEIQGLLQPE